MNRSEFQRAIGVAYTTILNWENGRTRPNADHLERIASVTGADLASLLGSDTNRTPSIGARRAPRALREFLRQYGARLTDDERRTLQAIVFYGCSPTVESYLAILAGLRIATPGPESSEPEHGNGNGNGNPRRPTGPRRSSR